MKKYLFLLILVSFLAGCGSGGGGSAPTPDNVENGGNPGDTSGNTGGNTGGGKANPACNGTGKIAKLKVSEDGVYRVTYSDLYGDCAGLSWVDPSTINLSSQGEDIAVDYTDSNGNNTFDGDDYIEFYGKAIGRKDSRFRFTETNVYWLSVGEKFGKSMEKVNPLTGQPPSPPNISFPRRLHVEKDRWYVQENYPEITSPLDLKEHWFWGDRIYPGDKINDTSFSTRYIDRSVPVSLKIRLQSVSLDHYTKVYINCKPGDVNCKPISENVWDSQQPYDLEITIPKENTSIFYSSGLNYLTIESAGGGLFYLDWFEVNYNREYKAEHNVLEFTGKNLMKLSGFTYRDVSIYEISDPANVQKINITESKATATGDYEVSFSSPYVSDGLFLALTADQKKSPLIELYTPSDIKSKQADYIIITHSDFSDAIKTLADYRTQQGYNVLTVKVRDIYDEFGDGLETPYSIKAFLKYANENWPVKPVHVLLVGDATIDYKDLSGYGEIAGVKSYVPAYLYNYPGLGEVPSDNWFVDINDDIVPEMNIGRIPAKFPDEVSSVISKIISHENSINKSSDVLLIADDDNPSFEGLSNSIADIITLPGYTAQKVYQSELKDGFKPAILSGIDLNPLIVNYTGHGAVTDWANNVFSSGDIEVLTNTGYPLVVALNCLNGYFVLADEQPYPSIAEAFLLGRDKGAVAVFAASPWGYLSDHDPLARELYSILFNENITLGEAITKAKTEAYTKGEIMEDVVQTFILFGDPATKLR